MLDDALDIGVELLSSVVGWRARRKERAAGQVDPVPVPDGGFAVWEVGAVRTRSAGHLWVLGDTLRWAGPGTAASSGREIPGHEVRFRIEPSARGDEGARVRLALPDARPLVVTVSHEDRAPLARPDADEENRLTDCAAELVDLLREAGAVEEDA